MLFSVDSRLQRQSEETVSLNKQAVFRKRSHGGATFWPSLFLRSRERRLWSVHGTKMGTRFTFSNSYWLCTRRGELEKSWEAGYRLPGWKTMSRLGVPRATGCS